MSQSFGTSDEITAAIEKYADMVRRICFLHLRNRADVEDVFQEVFLKFFLHVDALQDEAHQKAWLCRVTYNQCKDLCRSFWRRRVISLEGMEIPYESPEQGALIGAVLTLPPDQKQLVFLHYFEGRTIPEIADIMEKNENTVYSMLRRTKARLRQKVGDFE